MMVSFSDNVKIGMFMMGLGMVFLFLGVMLFFDRALLAIGNLLFIGSFPFLIGFKRTATLFNPMHAGAKRKGIICFLAGFVFVLFGWGSLTSILGMGLELYGAFNMFQSVIPRALGALSALPFIGNVLRMPIVSIIVRKISGQKPQSEA